MENFLFFDARRTDDFDTDGAGTEGTLGEHLEYLAEMGGSEDCWDTFEGTRQQAINQANQEYFPIYIVDACTYRVVGKTEGQ